MTLDRDVVEMALESLRPALSESGDGCEVETLDPEAGLVVVRLWGPCGASPHGLQARRTAIEIALRERVPEVRTIRLDAGF